MAKKAKRNWLLEIECTVRKSVVVANCTEDEARENPWKYAALETEIGMSDWTVRKIKPE